MSDVVRLDSADTNVRLDSLEGDQVQLVLSNLGKSGVVVTGSVSSVLMLVDRINDRVHHIRQGVFDG